MKSKRTFPSLSGTLAKRTNPALQPNFAKEPSSPSRSNAETDKCSIYEINDKMNKGQLVTRGHKTLGAKWLFERQFSHQSLLYLDSGVAPNSPTFHTAIR